ncbi:hypothetical protein P280DRAFT_474725 [Massarina eburnea CBS 473.64]|uniref:F-box domain-containing protein n=1 Tax=Massarina eburnea CBS 473.64 TaxID=1395130 RepID=A0A6A6RH41_9PLEO|nr:hypothetical protein P280DRAFT_474725 [Massarina eburnea CBS 473.64]
MDTFTATGQGKCPGFPAEFLPISNCSALPVETWAQILRDVDNPTLWKCRQLNKGIRAEADYEFRTSRLHALKFRWSLYFEIIGHPPPSMAEFPPVATRYDVAIATREWECHFSGASNDRVHYKFSIVCDRNDNRTEVEKGPRGSLIVKEVDVQKVIEEEITLYDNNCECISSRNSTQRMPSLDISIDWDSRTLSLDWKACLQHFFTQEAISQRLQKQGPRPQDATPNESAGLPSISEAEEANRRENDMLRNQRYQKWIEKVHDQYGEPCDLKVTVHECSHEEDVVWTCTLDTVTHLCFRTWKMQPLREEEMGKLYTSNRYLLFRRTMNRIAPDRRIWTQIHGKHGGF